MQTRSSNENSVCPSVRPSVCKTGESWQNGRKFCQGFYTLRKIIVIKIIIVSWGKEWLVMATPSTWNFGWIDPRWSEIADFYADIRS